MSINPAKLYLEKRSPLIARKSAIVHLNHVARGLGFTGWETCDWLRLKREHLTSLFSEWEKLGAPSKVINQALLSTKGVLHLAFDNNLITREHFAEIKNIMPVPFEAETDEQVHISVINECLRDGTVLSLRDAALIALAIEHNLLPTQIRGIKVLDVSVVNMTIHIRTLMDEKIQCSASTWNHVERWLAHRASASLKGSLFCHLNNDDRPIPYKGLSADEISQTIRNRYETAGFVRRFRGSLSYY